MGERLRNMKDVPNKATMGIRFTTNATTTLHEIPVTNMGNRRTIVSTGESLRYSW